MTLDDVLFDEVGKYFNCYYNIVPHRGKIEKKAFNQQINNLIGPKGTVFLFLPIYALYR